jgi:cell division protease FtsH
MEKKKQQFSIWYFVAAFIIILAIQNFFSAAHVETIVYSQFKAMLRDGAVSDLVIGERTIRGNVRGEKIKQFLPPGKVKDLDPEILQGKKPLPFVVVRVEDPDLTSELEQQGVSFRGDASNNWIPTILSWVVPVAVLFFLWC